MFDPRVSSLVVAVERLAAHVSQLHSFISSLRPLSVNMPRRAAVPISPPCVPFELMVFSGIVVEALSHIDAYRVQLDPPSPMIWACSLRKSTCTPSGAMTYGGYKPGDGVIVLVSHRQPMGIIIGAIPPPNTLGRMSYPISQVSGTHAGPDSPWRAARRMGSASNWSNGIPTDDSTGAFGAVAETGMMLHIDPFMACMKLNEITGLFMFYWDELLRLAGRNFQLWAGGHVMEAFNDNGELGVYYGDCIYPWELLGAISKDAEKAQRLRDRSAWLNTWEPKEADQKSFHRIFGFGGYLGMGRKRYVILPNQDAGDLHRYGKEKPDIGVFDSSIAVSGDTGFRTAGSFMFVKTPLIVPPHRRREPNDPTGDSDRTGYKPSGIGAAMIDPTLPWDREQEALRSLASPMSAVDAATHFFNVYTTTPIQEHSKDFRYPEEIEYGDEILETHRCEYVPDYRALSKGGVLPLPEKKTVRIDHRQTKDLYQCLAYITALEDGSIAIGDGYGAEIRMGGGKVFITAPGGIFFQSGREIASLAGGDIIQTANGSVDIVAKRDTRVAALKNLHIVGAVEGGAHGVLIESRSTYDDPSWYRDRKRGEETTIGGIRVLCPKSPFVVYSKDSHVVAHGQGSNPGTIKLEATTLSEGTGAQQGNVVLTGHNVYHNVDCAVFNCFTNDDKARDESPHQAFTAKAVYIDAPALFGRDVVAYGDIHVGKDVHAGSSDGRFFGANSTGMRWRQEIVAKAESTVGPRANRRTGEIPTDKYCFSARTDEQYCTQEFVLPETRYAKIARTNIVAGLEEWSPAIKITYGDGYESYTYPGDKAQQLEFVEGCFDVYDGCAKNRVTVSPASYTLTPLVLQAVERPKP